MHKSLIKVMFNTVKLFVVIFKSSPAPGFEIISWLFIISDIIVHRQDINNLIYSVIFTKKE